MNRLIKTFILACCILTAGQATQAEILSTGRGTAVPSISQTSQVISKALLTEVKSYFKTDKRPDQKDKKEQDKKEQDKKEQDKKEQDKKEQDKKEQDKKEQDKKEQDKKEQDKKEQDKKEQDKQKEKKKTDIVDWKKQFDKQMNQSEAAFKEGNEAFDKVYNNSLAKWKKERNAFIKRLDQYVENLVDPEILAPRNPETPAIKLQAVPVSPDNMDTYQSHFIPGAFDVPVRDQGSRGTCSAFTGIRAFETVAASFNKRIDLSEQYFYWSSKPECQKKSCSKSGSWYGTGLTRSLVAIQYDIPLEANCPYVSKKITNNETQTPLERSCFTGVAKALNFNRIQKNQILGELINNHPVLAAFKLSPNFYKSRGIISYADAFKAGKKDEHADGHAILLVGYFKLPGNWHDTEGKVCYVAANSWSEGWGKGGYACLTEKWVDHFSLAHMSLSTIEISPDIN